LLSLKFCFIGAIKLYTILKRFNLNNTFKFRTTHFNFRTTHLNFRTTYNFRDWSIINLTLLSSHSNLDYIYSIQKLLHKDMNDQLESNYLS